LAFAITLVVMVVELVGSSLSGSLALLADAGHMLADAAALAVALSPRGSRSAPRRRSAHSASCGWKCLRRS